MKKIITSLFCILAVSLFAQADDNAMINQCINQVLGGDNATMTIAAPNFDVNQDGAVNITDITIMINQDLQNRKQKTNAPAKLPQLKPAKHTMTVTKADGTVVTEKIDESQLDNTKNK